LLAEICDAQSMDIGPLNCEVNTFSMIKLFYASICITAMEWSLALHHCPGSSKIYLWLGYFSMFIIILKWIVQDNNNLEYFHVWCIFLLFYV